MVTKTSSYLMSAFKNIITKLTAKTSIKNELIAALTTFSTLAYSLILIPTVLAQAGMDFNGVLTATIITSAFATLLMGIIGNYPFALAPGVALNAYFTYSVVLGQGHSWQTALLAVFVCGVIFLILTLCHVRKFIINAIPATLRIATTAGLGLFLAFIGLKNSRIIVPHAATLVTFGNPKHPSVLLTALGLIFIAFFLYKKIPGAIILGILLNGVVAAAMGEVTWKGFVALPSGLDKTMFQLNFNGIFQEGFVGILLSLIFVGLFDTSGTLIGLTEQGRFLTAKGKIPRLNRALLPDALGSMTAGLLGTSTVGIYLESAAGIAAGAKTGLTAIFIAFLFLAALFFAPFAASIPLAVVTPVLIIIGAMMLRSLSQFDWEDPTEWVPGFVTLILIPLTSSVAIGIEVGFILWPILKLLTKKWKDVHGLSWALCIFFILKFFFFPEIL